MQNELTGTTAIVDGVVGILDAQPDDNGPADLNSTAGALPPNRPNSNPTTVAPIGTPVVVRDSTGPPNTNDYWHGLIDEKTAADFMDLTPRWLQAKRQHGDGPKFIRISQRCVKYTRYWLKTYADG